MDGFSVNLLAILIATVGAFALGGLWYSVFFGRAWGKASGLDPRNGYSPALVYPLAFLFNVVAAAAFGLLLGRTPGLGFALIRGVLVGLALVALSFSINYLGAGRKPALLFIDGGFHVIRFTLFGLVFGLVR